MIYDHYRTFLFVCKYKSVTSAAEALCTSQPAVTRTIKNLESELGCTLFTRTKRGMDLTKEGKILYEYVSASFYQLEKGENEIAKYAEFTRGIISLAATVTAIDECLLDYVSSYVEKHENVRFSFSTQSSNESISMVKNGTVDLAFVTTPFEYVTDLTFTELKSFNNVIICGPKYKEFAERTDLTIKDLLGIPFISLNKDMQLREYVDNLFASNNLKYKCVHEVDSADLIIKLVKNNFGIGIVPMKLAEDFIKCGEIFEVHIKEQMPERKVFMVSNPNLPRSKYGKDFRKMVAASIEEK